MSATYHPPKAVVFDLGKVLLEFDYTIAMRQLAAHSATGLEPFQQVLGDVSFLRQYESGAISSQELFSRLRRASGFRGSFEDFADLFGNIFTPIEPMVRLHAALRADGFPTFVFSNTNDLAVRYIRAHYPFYSNFDGYILSFEHGSMKPEAALYEVVERTAGLRGPDLLYLDDRPENVASGVERGWQSILHESPGETARVLRASYGWTYLKPSTLTSTKV